ncbi:MAG: cytochrome c [Bacteroidales bacterium]|nr:cytochrome c [Bacteroidales bacterium]
MKPKFKVMQNPKISRPALLQGLLIMLVAIAVNACYYDNEEDLYPMSNTDCDTTNVTYSGTVQPILNANCASCHNETTANGNVIVSNYPDLMTVVNNGRFWGAINHEPGYTPMPQGGGKLSECRLAKIRKWIDMGAPNN